MTSSSSATQQLQNLKLFGRRYRLRVTIPSQSGAGATVIDVADSAFEPEALRMTFDVRTVFFKAAWAAEIVLYNLDLNTTLKITGGIPDGTTAGVVQPLVQGMNVQLEAGYQKGPFGTIWSGPVFQVLFVRENVTDFKLTLSCIIWLDQINRSPVMQNIPANLNQTAIIQSLAKQAFGDKTPVAISPSVSPSKGSRGSTLFGSVAKYLDQMGDDNNMQWFLSDRGLTFARIDNQLPTTATAKVFTPDTGIIGTPMQTQQGVDVTLLLDPTVRVQYPAMLIKIDNSQIVQQKRQLGEYPGILDQDGIYIVGGVRYQGDTRGTAWYAHVTGYVTANRLLALLNNQGSPLNSPS